MPKEEPSGTIAINEPGPYAFGDTITFTTTHEGLKGTQYPMVYVEARSVVDDELLSGQLDHPTAAFKLGGDSSEWHTDRDDANCRATLFAYGGKGQTPQIMQLAEPVEFFATG